VANTKQAEKRHGQSLKRRDRNRYQVSTLKGLLKSARAAVDAQDANASELVTKTTSALDKVASKGAIPRQRAARLKSRLMLRLQKSA
jgi:small subunit ribosomal protein S20